MSGATGSAASATREELANHLTFRHLDLTDPQFHEYARAHAAAMREEIASLLAEAVAAGELAGADPVRLARAVHVAYNGSLIVWALTGEGSLAGALRTDLETLITPYLKEKET